MARTDRTTFHTDEIELFCEFMAKQGYIKKKSTNEYEILRFMKADETMEIVNYYKRERSDFLTLTDKNAFMYFQFMQQGKE